MIKNEIPEHMINVDFVSPWLERLYGSTTDICLHHTVYNYDLTSDKEFKATVDMISKAFNQNALTKEKPMKQKKFYHTFEITNEKGNLEREITLCILTEESAGLLYWTNQGSTVKIGYSVRVSSDKNIPGLSKKIALGRAEKTPINGGKLDTKYLFDNGVLKGIAYYWENEFRRDLGKYIKGAR